MEFKHISNKWLLLKKIKKSKFPLAVRSSAIKIFDLIIGNPEYSRLAQHELAVLVILIACKCEDFQGTAVNITLNKLAYSKRLKMVGLETTFLNTVGFNFHFPSPYTKAYAILIMLQERGAVVVLQSLDTKKDPSRQVFIDRDKIIISSMSVFWNQTVNNIDYILCIERRDWTELEIAYAALGFPVTAFRLLSFQYSEETTEFLLKKVEEVRKIIQKKRK